ncbi:RNase H family protein [Lachnotalea glycerini]|uniref:RNase H type-1 domain-containing protein n=1 Tax=Lachnotalea glycerini TaxID=1763509 RepID=A0A371JBV7_9FIRM|nr:RNase H family protein [Lachnotalea glycerini]RDY30168.1 hypothetical protein CG710_016140 [Lachnotalea glycerini]
MFDVNIYIETTIRSANAGTGYYGYVVEYFLQKNQEPVTRQEIESEEKVTANLLKLLACYRALEILKKPCQVTIYVDSNYVESGIKTWMHNWYQTDWVNSKGNLVKNKDIWKPLHALSKLHFISVENVKAHNYSAWLQDEIKKRRKQIEKNRA